MNDNNQKNCEECGRNYENDFFNIYSNDIKDFCKGLGFCNVGCYDDFMITNKKELRKLIREFLVRHIRDAKKE